MSNYDIDVQIGKKLRLRRTEKGLTQEAIAKAVGVSFQQVQKYEKGANTLNARRLQQFAQTLHTKIGYFFDELDSPRSGSIFSESTIPKTKDTDSLGNYPPSERESLEIMKAFKRIKNPLLRKRFADLLRAAAED